MKKFNTYKEFQDYSFCLERKSRECALTESDELDYVDINNIKKELTNIRNSQKDLFWEAIIASLMEEKTKKEYKIVDIERTVQARREDKLIDVTLNYHFITPTDYDEDTITSDDILNAGEYAKEYYDKGIIIYFDNTTQVGVPLDVYYRLNEIIFNMYKANHIDNKSKRIRKKSQ